MKTQYEFHPAAEVYPLLAGTEKQEMVDSIKKTKGLHEKISLLDGKIIDGRNRFLCAREAGVPLDHDTDFHEIRTYLRCSGLTPAEFVIDKNSVRRHLTNGQKAAAGAKLNKLFAEEGNQRRAEKAATGNKGPSGSTDPHGPEPLAAEKAAKAVGTSPANVKRGSAVQDNGIAEVQQAMESDEISVTAAAKIAKLPADQQLQALEDLRAEKKRKAEEKAAGKTKAPKNGSEAVDGKALTRAKKNLSALIKDLGDLDIYESLLDQCNDITKALNGLAK